MSLLSAGKNAYSMLTGGFAAMGQSITNFGVEMGSQWIADFGYGFGGGINAGATTAGLLGSAAGIAAGAGIGLMGGKLISGGYSAWGASGNRAVNTGTAAGAAIGSIVPGLGTALGAVVGGCWAASSTGPSDVDRRSMTTPRSLAISARWAFSGYTSTPGSRRADGSVAAEAGSRWARLMTGCWGPERGFRRDEEERREPGRRYWCVGEVAGHLQRSDPGQADEG